VSTSRAAALRGGEPPLNPPQLLAAETLHGPVLVIAGAGTGKTHTLVHRLVRLVEAGIDPESILLLTFTRRAAQEMIKRASALLEGRCDRVAGGTFHSFAHRTLRRYGPAIGIASDFTILDQADSFEILSGLRSEAKRPEDGQLPRRETIAAIISRSINHQVSIAQALDDEYSQFTDEVERLEEIARRYVEYKRERQQLDFDDLLVHLVRLLEESPEAAARVRERHRYVMVDEYQDTNLLQARITRLLAGENANVMVVGDDAQSIYRFRGAHHRNLFEFREAFTEARLITIEENFRSTQPVLDLANALMRQMSKAFRKKLFTRREGGENPLLIDAVDEEEEARFVATVVERLREGGVRLDEMGVLFRASRHAFALEVELQHRGIPYVKYGGFRFMEAAHIKDVLAHLRVVANPGDDLSLTRALQLREGIGKGGARKIARSVAGKPLVAALRDYSARGAVRAGIDHLARLLEALQSGPSSPSESLGRVVEDYLPILELRFDDWPRRKRDLEQLVLLCRRYRSLSSMLSDLTLEPPTSSANDSLAAEARGDRLVLSTVHSAKGLEWRAVFVIHARDGLIPMVSSYEDQGEDPETLDEELRLMYVAVTRAKDALYATWPAATGRGYGYGLPMPSRFLDSVPGSVLVRCPAGPYLRSLEAEGKRRRSTERA
jgi:DNA helicase-2/ATP-dependent DNA helicase PcrA